MRKSPPLPAIEAFMIAAEHRSFRAAAAQLSLSPSALSRRISTLESYLGTQLFERIQDGVCLTNAGADYLDAISEPIERIRRSTEHARRSASKPVVRVMASHSILSGWLVPNSIQLASESFDVEFLIGRTRDDYRRGKADILIHSGPRPMDGMEVRKLFDLDVVAVSAPMLAEGRPAPKTLHELVDAPRVGVHDEVDLWMRWWSLVGGEGQLSGTSKTFETILLMMEATASGAGATLGIPPHANRFLLNGSIIQCSERIVRFDRYYAVAFREELSPLPKPHHKVVEWIEDLGATTEKEFQRLVA